MSTPAGAIWLYPWDLLDEGPELVLPHVRDQGGLTAVHLAVCYHAGLFLLPHNPRRKVYFPLDGAVYYRPDPAAHEGNLLQPLVHPMIAEDDPLAAALEHGARLGVAVAAWVVPTHNTRMGMYHPDCTQVNAFDDHHFPSLCPAHPEVRAYAAAVVADVARYGPAAIIVESLEYMPAEHGYHHEVIGIRLTPLASLLLGLCFCPHCLQRARFQGVDGEAVRRAVADILEAFFAGRGPAMAPDLDVQALAGLATGEMAGFLAMRRETVTSLQAEVTAAARRSWSGILARCDFAPLHPAGIAVGHLRSGVDLAALRSHVDRLDPTLYSPDPATVGEMLRVYAASAPAGIPMMPALRAIRPQTETREGLLAAVRAARAAGATQLSFYNYGFMRLETLAWIREALREPTAQTARGSARCA